MNAIIYIEGGASSPGGASKYLNISCQKAFHKLLAQLGLKRQPGLVACGSRNKAYDRFCTAVKSTGPKPGSFIARLVDSEDKVTDPEKPWTHLKDRDHWEQPPEATDEQVFLMTTCMETWIVADRPALNAHYGHKLQENALPPLHNLERRDRHAVHDGLERATRSCSNAYRKGKRSFEVLGKLEVAALRALPAFARMERVLKARL